MPLIEASPLIIPKAVEYKNPLDKVDKLGLLALLSMRRREYSPVFLIGVEIQKILSKITDRRGFEELYFNYNGLIWPTIDLGLLQKQMDGLVNIELAKVVERGVVNLSQGRGITIHAVQPVYALTRQGEEVQLNF